MGWAEQRVVGGDEPELDRKAHLQLALTGETQHPAHRLRPVLARDRVLHLREPDAALRGEHPVAAVGPLAVREPARGEADQPRDRGGKAAAEPGEQVEGVVLEHDLVEVGADPPARARGAVDAVALDRQRRIRVGEDEELEVVVARRQLVQIGQGLIQRAGRVDPMQGEAGHGSEGDRVDDPERAKPHAGGSKGGGIGLLGELEEASVGQHELQRLHLGGEVSELGAGAVRGGRDRAGEGLAVDVAEVLHRQAPLPQRRAQVPQGDPRLHLDQAGVAVDVEDAVQRLDPDHRSVGESGLGEGVARAGGVDREAAIPRPPHGLAEALQAPGPLDHRRRAALIAGPVSPLAGHRPTKPMSRRGAACAPVTLLARAQTWSGGRVRFIAAALKAAGPQGPGGSNPSRSAHPRGANVPECGL